MNTEQASRHISHSTKKGAASIIHNSIQLTKTRLTEAVCLAQDAPKNLQPRYEERVILATAKLAHSIATHEYLSWASMLPPSVDYCYVYNSALQGLHHAIRKYDRTKLNDDNQPYAFTTYASPWIKQATQRCIYTQCTHMGVGWERIRVESKNIPRGLAISDLSSDTAHENTQRGEDEAPTIGQLFQDDHALSEYEHIDSQHAAQSIIDHIDALDLSKPSTERRKKILQLVSEGYNQKEIAQEVGLSAQLVGKLITKTGTQLARKGLKHKILQA